MTTPANAIREEVWELINAQIKTFGQASRLMPSDLSECSYRTQRIRQLGQELDQIGTKAILERRFGRAS